VTNFASYKSLTVIIHVQMAQVFVHLDSNECLMWPGTRLLDVLHDTVCNGAAVKDICPFLRYPLVRVRQFEKYNNIVFLQDVFFRVTKHFAGTGTQGQEQRRFL